MPGRVKIAPSRSLTRTRIATCQCLVALGSCYKERFAGMDFKEPFEIQVTPIHDVVGTWVGQKIVQHIHIVQLTIRDVDEFRNRASQIQQSVKLHRTFRLSESCPRKHRKTQVDSRGVQRVDCGVQIYAEIFFGVEPAGFGNSDLSKVRIDPPIPLLVRIG